jgi:hypothetical protein
MAIWEMFYFNKNEYQMKIQELGKGGNKRELATREVLKRRQINSTKVRLIFCGALLLPTCGMTVVGFLLALRKRKLAKEKYRIVVNTINHHRIGLPKHRNRDWLIPIVVNTSIYVVTFGIIWGLDHVANEAWEYLMPNGFVPVDDCINTSTEATAQQFLADPGLFMEGVVHGTQSGVGFIDAAVSPTGNVVNDIANNSMPFGTPAPFVYGAEVGSGIVMEAIRTVPGQALGQLQNFATGVPK